MYLFERQLYFIWEEAPSREITPRVCDLQRPLVQESLGKYTYALMTISIVLIFIIVIMTMLITIVIKVTFIIIIIIIISAGVAGEMHVCSEGVHSWLWWQSPLWRWRSKSRRISHFESWPGFSLWTLRDQLEAKPIQNSSIAFKLGQGLPSVYSSSGCALNHQKLIDSTFYNLFQKWEVSPTTNANVWIAQIRWMCSGAKLQLSSGKVKTARHLQILSCYLEFYWQSELICTKNHSAWVLLAEQTNLYKLLFNLICKKIDFYWKQGGSPNKQK